MTEDPKGFQPDPKAKARTAAISADNVGMSASPRPLRRRSKKLLLLGALFGLVYGMILRWGAQTTFHGWTPVMSVSFLLLVPFAVGFITVFVVERREPQPAWIWFVLPWVPVLGGSLGAMLMFWEGFICVIMFAPVALFCASLGGLIAGILLRIPRIIAAKNTGLALVAILPLLTHPWLHELLTRRDVRNVENVRVIHASPEIVWYNIERVSRVARAELPFSWAHRIGFPSPVEATLSYPGIGGVRHATFEGGVLFIENIDVWEPEHRLAFSIHAQTDQIPPTTLDDHVHIGGPFFDVLRGEYVIEPLSDGSVRLHLSSQHRVSTDFNWYAHFWTDGVMADIQETILTVIQKRCEAKAQGRTAQRGQAEMESFTGIEGTLSPHRVIALRRKSSYPDR
jgi:hypothetical protein